MVDPNNPNLGAQIRDEQQEIQVELTRATRRLNLSVLQATRQLAGQVTAFVNPINRLQDSLTRLDKTNRASLALGTTTDKLRKSVEANSDVLDRGLVSTQKLMDAIVQNFESGVRVQNGAIADLTEEMIATGQDLNGLTSMNSDLLLFTGDNIRAVQDANRANREISDKYGVSNQKLIDSVNSLKSTFEEASFFGGETTASLETLTMELKARTGGKNVEGAIQTLIGLGTGGLGNLGAAMRTGAGGLRSRISGGQAVGMGDIMPILQQVSQIAQQSGGGNLALGADIAAMRTGLSRQQVVQLVNLNQQLQKDYTLNAESKKTTDETFNNIQNINERARNFYDKTAIQSLALLGSISTATIGMAANTVMAGGGLAGLLPAGGGGLAGGAARIGSMLPRLGGAAALGTAAYGAKAATGGGFLSNILTGASVGAIGGPMGAVAGAAGGLIFSVFESIKGNTEETAEEVRKQREMEEEQRRQEAAIQSSKDIARVSFLAQYIRSRGGADLNGNTELYLEAIAKNIQEMNSKSTTPKSTLGRGK
jgi:hypothetical protein